VNLKRKMQLERMLREVATLHLWELGIAEISDDMAWASTMELVAWLNPIVDWFEARTKEDEKK